MKKRLITSALPYVNNIPHLGNLIQVLSADVFARFCRLRGYETLYVCGTDEYGTTTTAKAMEEGVTPRELCDRYFKIHDAMYKWFNIAFDRFGRTSTPEQTAIVQDIFTKCDANGYIREQTLEQLYCLKDEMFLADRYIHGTCPHCGSDKARGDQCDACGKLLDPADLKAPRCGICGSTPESRSTKHLFIDLPAVRPRLEEWMKKASVDGFWANNAIQMTQAWIRDGLRERCITRDLKWGIPVPKKGYEDKVFYVWFDAPIGYISISACHTPEWERWWKNPSEVELYQFIGKDNIPFHTVIFPSSLLGSGDPWTMLHHMSSTEYLNYEGEKFSKSRGIGVFGNDAQDTGIPADVWRFYIYYNRPESKDADFSWKEFQDKTNGELIGNLSNLVNRTLTFVQRYYGGRIPQRPLDPAIWAPVGTLEAEITALLERAELRDGLHRILALSNLGNKAFQDGEPWKTRTTEPEKAETLIATLTCLLKDLSILISPYIPETAARLQGFLKQSGLSWNDLGKPLSSGSIEAPQILFAKLEDELIARLKERFKGTQKEREGEATEKSNAGVPAQPKAAPGPTPKAFVAEKPPQPVLTPAELVEAFASRIDLRVAKIVAIERHPKADKLYVEKVDDGASGGERQIVSGLVPHYKPEELLGRHVILAANLKTAVLRGTESRGMLLAASKEGVVEVLFADHAAPGTRVFVEGKEDAPAPSAEIDIDGFFGVPIVMKAGSAQVGGKALLCGGKALTASKVDEGEVG